MHLQAVYGTPAHKDGKERAVPDYWQEHVGVWLHGYDGTPMSTNGAKPVSDQMEATVDEEAIRGLVA